MRRAPSVSSASPRDKFLILVIEVARGPLEDVCDVHRVFDHFRDLSGDVFGRALAVTAP
jgi:hypothetical protein